MADTTRALRVLETHHAPTYYLPQLDIHATLRPTEGSSLCEWKGIAHYFDVLAGSATAQRAAWAYDQPTASFAALAAHVAFHAALMHERFVTCIVEACSEYPQIEALDICLRKRPVLSGVGTFAVRLIVDAKGMAALRDAAV